MEAAAAVTLVIIEDNPALRRGLELVLRSDEFRIVGLIDDAEGAYDLIRRQRPDVVLTDISVRGRSGIELTRQVLRDTSGVGIVVYTRIGERALVSEALDCGARGLALKASPPEDLREAIRTVARGGYYVDSALKPLLARSKTEGVVLSRREREVLDLLAQGLTGEEAATRLQISPETIRTHVRNAMNRLDARTRAHAIVIALRQGEISGQ